MMNITRELLAALSIAGMTLGCSQHDHATEQAAAGASTPVSNATAAHAPEIPAVELDDGNRWKANQETTEGIANMSALLASFDSATSNGDTLKDELEQVFQLIFERCTMDGEAHVQLHNYLIPIHHSLREFDANDPLKREALSKHLAAYGSYFE